jgi:hypothetical protein
MIHRLFWRHLAISRESRSAILRMCFHSKCVPHTYPLPLLLAPVTVIIPAGTGGGILVACHPNPSSPVSGQLGCMSAPVKKQNVSRSFSTNASFLEHSNFQNKHNTTLIWVPKFITTKAFLAFSPEVRCCESCDHTSPSSRACRTAKVRRFGACTRGQRVCGRRRTMNPPPLHSRFQTQSLPVAACCCKMLARLLRVSLPCVGSARCGLLPARACAPIRATRHRLKQGQVPLLQQSKFHTSSSARKRDPYEVHFTHSLSSLIMNSSLRFWEYRARPLPPMLRKRELARMFFFCNEARLFSPLLRYLAKAKILHPDVNK